MSRASWTVALAKQLIVRLVKLVAAAQSPSATTRAAAVAELHQALEAVPKPHQSRRRRVLRLVRARQRARDEAAIRAAYHDLLPSVQAVKKVMKTEDSDRSLQAVADLPDAKKLAVELAFDWTEELVADLLDQAPKLWLCDRLGEAEGKSGEVIRNLVHRNPVKR